MRTPSLVGNGGEGSSVFMMRSFILSFLLIGSAAGMAGAVAINTSAGFETTGGTQSIHDATDCASGGQTSGGPARTTSAGASVDTGVGGVSANLVTETTRAIVDGDNYEVRQTGVTMDAPVGGTGATIGAGVMQGSVRDHAGTTYENRTRIRTVRLQGNMPLFGQRNVDLSITHDRSHIAGHGSGHSTKIAIRGNAKGLLKLGKKKD